MTKQQGHPSSSYRRQQQQRQQQQEKRSKDDIDAFIPPYLRQFITPHRGDFCYTRIFHFRLIAQLMSEGFLPIATEGVLLPKLHEYRCVVSLPNDLHISRSIRKKSKRYSITINQAFERVIDGCSQQHGKNCWLYPPLVEGFRSIQQAGKVDTVLMQDGKHPTGGRVCPVRLYSIELWNTTTNALAGGELGYTVGSVYTSLTGFSAEDSAGSVQLAALGRLLCRLGFSLWDLGMEMDYKKSIGSKLMPRQTFVQHVKSVRETKGYLVLQLPTTDDDITTNTANTTVDHPNNNSNMEDILPKMPFANARTIIDDPTPIDPPSFTTFADLDYNKDNSNTSQSGSESNTPKHGAPRPTLDDDDNDNNNTDDDNDDDNCCEMHNTVTSHHGVKKNKKKQRRNQSPLPQPEISIADEGVSL